MNELRSEVKSDLGIREPRKEVASIAVVHNGKLLMGQRRDNGRWTFPGGHLNPGEDAHIGAKRELFEEAGLRSHGLDPLGSEDITSYSGKQMRIHAFKHNASSPVSHSFNDPDREVAEWKWIDISKGLPHEIAANLHSPKNIVLQKLGLQ